MKKKFLSFINKASVIGSAPFILSNDVIEKSKKIVSLPSLEGKKLLFMVVGKGTFLKNLKVACSMV